MLYRGVKLKEKEADAYEAGTKIHLQGFTSTSQRFATALRFAYINLDDDYVPVVFEIFF